ncbi:alpha-dioxygenase 2 isoform X1 [Cannabis sativa]|uniref:alpha-dioxygenase 2 isoform X1 n=1 Tax=Cannabis sativa TaxID=3483 RepID=UPI0029C9EC6E|nr:alpha-dioxygenase 2 isoform X1 [Cannabis sativa]
MVFSLSTLIHPQLHPILLKMTFFDTFLFFVIHMVDRVGIWHKLPVIIGIAYLGIRRHLHQRYNLFHVGKMTGKESDVKEIWYRTADGKCNFQQDDLIGSQGTFFGRNMPPSTSPYGVLDPHPSLVASKLLERKKFKDNGKQFNMIACSWIQFMIHDWVDHLEDTNQMEIIGVGEEENIASNGCPLKSFKFFKTKKVPTFTPQINFGCLNTRTPWWDGSVVYGNNNEGMRRVRSFKDGKLKISKDMLLEHDEKGIPISGDVRNCWAGFSLLQVLFVKEHNVVCDMLKEHNPKLDDENLYRHARLVVSAVIAKVHTIDWTIELLKTDTLLAGMRINWYGLLGKRIKDMFGHICGPLLSGLVGLKKPRDHGIPYSLTEEFVSVYRMHSLLPEKFILRDIKSTPSKLKSPPIIEEIPMEEMIGKEGEKRLSKIGLEQMLVSLGHQACGELSLWNYPTWMRNLIAHDINGEDRPQPIDMAALEIYRDRERGVARYNEFRRNLLMVPITKWEDLTCDEEAIEALNEVYGDDVEKLDLLVGLHAEKKIKGFAISETSFFIFLLIASRRLEADRFFTSNFNMETYTKEGFEWVNKTESLKDVIDRHFPNMTKKWMCSSSAFSVWDSLSIPNYIPLYMRLPT